MAEKTLLQKYAEALLKVENPKLDSEAEVKTNKGYTYKYKYASLGECMRVVKDACKDLGLGVYFDIVNNCVYTVVTDGQEIRSLSSVPAKLDGLPQSNGSEITYAKRYSLSAAFGLVSEEDDDAQMAQNQQKTNKPVNTQQKQQDARKTAQNRLKKVLVEYHRGDKDAAKSAYDELWHMEGFQDTAEWFDSYANELLTELRAYA